MFLSIPDINNDQVITAILNKKNAVSVQLDHQQCGMGKWLYGGEADALTKEFRVFAPLIEWKPDFQFLFSNFNVP